MNQIRPLLLTALLFCCSNYLYAQAPWSGVLSSARAINWSNAGATITNRTTQCGSTIAAYSGTAATINSAISSCTPGDYVQLGAGTFNLSTSIVTTTSNVTLRGMGPNQTFLVFSATSSNCSGYGGTAICVWNGDSNALNNLANVVSWTAGYSPGTTQLTFSSTSNLHVGSLVILTQQDDASDTGNVYVCQTFGANGDCTWQGTTGNARPGWGQTQNVQVTNVSGTTVTVNPGLYLPQWSSSKTPEAYWSNSLPITGFGIENLSIDFSAAGNGWSGIMFWLATNCWVKGVRTVNNYTTGSSFVNHLGIYQSNHVTVRDSYMYGSNPASEGYGLMIGVASADCLVENNIGQHIASSYLTDGSEGTVFGYNYAVDNFYNGNGTAPTWQQSDAIHHNIFDTYNLIEGHEGIDYGSDDIHGTSAFLTVFRSYFSGFDTATQDYGGQSKNRTTNAYVVDAAERYHNLVGSVIGTQSYHTAYLRSPASTTECVDPGTAAGYVILTGYSSGYTTFSNACLGESFTVYDDQSIYNGTNTGNLMLWGNYAACTGDAACNAVRWQSSENASGASTYPGLSNPSQTLPASFYYTSQPSWWPSNITWPPIGPDVAGGNVANVGGHVYLNPAANCYLNVLGGSTNGSTGLLTFNANACYGAPSPVAPPTNVSAVAH